MEFRLEKEGKVNGGGTLVQKSLISGHLFHKVFSLWCMILSYKHVWISVAIVYENFIRLIEPYRVKK